jgi:iodotyrosine deiodinase
MKEYPFIELSTYERLPIEEMRARAEAFYARMRRRRSVREFSDEPVPRDIIEDCLRAAGTAPSGANMQPWQFVVVSDSEVKKRIRQAAEEVEADFYQRRAPDYWLEALAPLGTDEHKPYLEEAPYLIVIFSRRHTELPNGTIQKHYYLAESVGIATGILITALHTAGLACLTHTPSPMAFLRDVLERPKTETPYLVLVTGYPKTGCKVPDIGKKDLGEIATFM